VQVWVGRVTRNATQTPGAYSPPRCLRVAELVPLEGRRPARGPHRHDEVVHLHGSVDVHDDSTFVRSIVTALTKRQLRAIIGIEMAIDRVVAKRKLSQNHRKADQAGVMNGLRRTSDRRHHDAADLMNHNLT
jgi:predicted FMN-binding regulatory protein PaiB